MRPLHRETFPPTPQKSLPATVPPSHRAVCLQLIGSSSCPQAIGLMVIRLLVSRVRGRPWSSGMTRFHSAGSIVLHELFSLRVLRPLRHILDSCDWCGDYSVLVQPLCRVACNDTPNAEDGCSGRWPWQHLVKAGQTTWQMCRERSNGEVAGEQRCAHMSGLLPRSTYVLQIQLGAVKKEFCNP